MSRRLRFLSKSRDNIRASLLPSVFFADVPKTNEIYILKEKIERINRNVSTQEDHPEH